MTTTPAGTPDEQPGAPVEAPAATADAASQTPSGVTRDDPTSGGAADDPTSVGAADDPTSVGAAEATSGGTIADPTSGGAADATAGPGEPAGAPGDTADTADAADPADAVTDPIAQAVAPGYAFEGAALELGGLMLDVDRLAPVPIRIPLAMTNRHGLVAGATGTGKTKTLQLMAEQLSAAGVPVFAADIKGDLSGLSVPGEDGEKIRSRAASVGQRWQAQGFPVEFYALGGQGTGIPLRVTMSAFGPTLLSKVLDLNDTQESSLGLIFHYADKAGLPLLDLADLRALVQYLVSDEGKAELKALGGISSATAGVILRELIGFSDQGADAFFGEPEFDSVDLLATSGDRGLISLVELPQLADRPAVFSTFLMWLLADLFHDLPEVGDIDKPKLVFFFDEAHLLFKDASKAFLEQIAQTVRLIRSKGVGVFFVTQSPTDVPDEVLAQLGSRIQHQLRAHTPNDAKALKATVNTYPTSAYPDLGEVITTLGIGEAVVTVMSERGAPTPVAWTRLRAPESLMGTADAAAMEATVRASPRYARYSETVDRESARELLVVKLEAGAAAAEAERVAAEQAKVEAKEAATAAKDAERAEAAAKKQEAKEAAARAKEAERAQAAARQRAEQDGGLVQDVMSSGAFKDFMRTAAREIARGMFGSGRRR